MYILSGDKHTIFNSDFVQRFLVDNKGDAVLIEASYSTETKITTIARYKTIKEAEEALADLFFALAHDDESYTMPDSLYYGEQRQIKDARVKRRGGS